MTKLEEVARIIAEGVADDLASEGIARQVIEAMRIPTDEMIRAAQIAIMAADDGVGETWDYWIDGYGPAIDAAIDPSKS